MCMFRHEPPLPVHLFGEDGDVLAEGVGGADVSPGHGALPRRAGCQFTFLKDECEQRE